MVDFDTLDTKAHANRGAVLEIQHPHSGAPLRQDDGSPVTITLAGQDSDAFTKFERKLTDKRLSRAARNRNVTLTSAELENDRVGRLVACTMAWNGIAWGGASKECTPENARELFTRWPWALLQAEQFIEDRANFTQAA